MKNEKLSFRSFRLMVDRRFQAEKTHK